MPSYRIVIIGAGNVATHLAKACQGAGHQILAICSRNIENVQLLAAAISCECLALDRLEHLPEADFYLISTSDSAISTIVEHWPAHCKKGIVAHTAGSIPLGILSSMQSRVGVIYPLQTFSKERNVDFQKIPCFVEGDSTETEAQLMALAQSITQLVQPLSSEQRKVLHIAAVFACNFVNHLYDIAVGIAQEQGINPDWLQPLIEETAAKVANLSPRAAQTGPAVRGDQTVLHKQSEMLEHKPELQQLYQLLSQSIYQKFHP